MLLFRANTILIVTKKVRRKQSIHRDVIYGNILLKVYRTALWGRIIYVA